MLAYQLKQALQCTCMERTWRTTWIIFILFHCTMVHFS